jgi:hypothetical protein
MLHRVETDDGALFLKCAWLRLDKDTFAQLNEYRVRHRTCAGKGRAMTSAVKSIATAVLYQSYLFGGEGVPAQRMPKLTIENVPVSVRCNGCGKDRCSNTIADLSHLRLIRY